MYTLILNALSAPVAMNNSSGYAIGAVIGLLILGYLFYSLIHPEKF